MPGHAKTLVAAYLISRHGSWWHAVVLAVVVTFTHTALVVVLGIILWIYQRTHPQLGPALQLWLGAIAGLLVAAMGLRLLGQGLRGRHAHAHSHAHPHLHGHHHNHEHDHPHEHLHNHGPEPITIPLLLALGITGGIVPCPTATIIMLLGIGANVILGALYAVGIFSLGLALTLMAVGFAALSSRRIAARLVTGSSHQPRLSPAGQWLLNHVLPAGSGLAVLALGAAIATHYLYILRTGTPLLTWMQ
jgi:ABC-type nickel/cobalt efflux system permease component RcnA